MRPLVIITADAECAATLKGFFGRDGYHHSLGCGPIQLDRTAFDPERDIRVHPGRDPGVWKDVSTLLLPERGLYERALIVLDEAFEGAPQPDVLVGQIENLAETHGRWARDRFEVILIRPELEAWIWQRNRHVAEAFEFPGSESDLWRLLEDQSLALDKRTKKHHFVQADSPSGLHPAWPANKSKPDNPKGVVEALASHCQSSGPPSVIFNEITSQVSTAHCVDQSFHKLREALRRWFPAEEAVWAQ